MTTNFPSLNENERTAFRACVQNTKDVAGGDFGFTDEIRTPDGMTRNQLKGYLGQLTQKGYVRVYPPETFNVTSVIIGQFDIQLWPNWIEGDPVNSVSDDKIEPRG